MRIPWRQRSNPSPFLESFTYATAHVAAAQQVCSQHGQYTLEPLAKLRMTFRSTLQLQYSDIRTWVKLCSICLARPILTGFVFCSAREKSRIYRYAWGSSRKRSVVNKSATVEDLFTFRTAIYSFLHLVLTKTETLLYNDASICSSFVIV